VVDFILNGFFDFLFCDLLFDVLKVNFYEILGLIIVNIYAGV